MACGSKVSSCVDAKTQNDIADFLRSLIERLKKLAEWFDALTADAAAAQAANPCLAGYFEGTREDATKAVEQFLMGQPDRLRTLFECFRGADGQLPQRVAIQIDGKPLVEIDWEPLLLCAAKAAASWIVNRDTITALVMFATCAFGGLIGGGGGPDPTPVEADPVGKAKKRC